MYYVVTMVNIYLPWLLQFTYSQDRLEADHERGNTTIARRNIRMYEFEKLTGEDVEEEIPPPTKCAQKQRTPKPVDPCQAAPSGLAAL